MQRFEVCLHPLEDGGSLVLGAVQVVPAPRETGRLPRAPGPGHRLALRAAAPSLPPGEDHLWGGPGHGRGLRQKGKDFFFFFFKLKTSAFKKNTQFSMDLSGNANKRVETLFRVRESRVVSSGLACVGVGGTSCIFFNQRSLSQRGPSLGWPHL